MYICILCPHKDIKEAREKAKNIPYFADHTSLTIPVSEEGELPITHWFCTFDASPELSKQIQDAAFLCTVELENPKTFLRKHNLRMIKLDKVLEAKNKGELDEI